MSGFFEVAGEVVLENLWKVVKAIPWSNAHRFGYKRISVEIHYEFKSRSDINFESLSTINVIKKNIKQYKTAIHGARQQPHIESSDPSMHVVLDEHASGEVRTLVVHFDTDVSNGEKQIPLKGNYVDTTMINMPRLPIRLNTYLKQLVIAVRLPKNEVIRKANAKIHKSDGLKPIMNKQLHIWQNNLAYYRAFTNIPFAKEIADIINAKELSESITIKDPAQLAKLLIAFEARFKSIDAVLKEYPYITNFLELPSGFSTRGLAMTIDNPAITFVECDLPTIIQKKQKRIGRILDHENKPAIFNLHYHIASILDFEQLEHVVSQSFLGPVAIITEGLLSYLTPKEKIVAANNVRKLLFEKGGVWVVSDLTRLFKPDDAKAAELRKRISTATGFSPITGCFGSNAEAKRFFKRLGFKVRDHRRSDVIAELSTANLSDLTNSEIEEFLKLQATFALEI